MSDEQSPQDPPLSQELAPQQPPAPPPAPFTPVQSVYLDNEVAHEIRNRETQRRAMEAAVTRSEVQKTVVAVEQIDMENQEQLLVYYEGKIQELELKLSAAQTPVTQALYQRQLDILTQKVDAVISGNAPDDFGKLPQHRSSILPQPVSQTLPHPQPVSPIQAPASMPETIVHPEDVRRISGPPDHILTGLLLAVRDGKHYRPLLPQEKEAIEQAINT